MRGSLKRVLASVKLPFTLLLLCLIGSVAAAVEPVRILLVTGIDHPAHDWRKTAPAIKGLLEAEGQMEVRIVEDPSVLDSATLTNYAAVLLHFQNWQVAGPGAAARENLRRYVESGGGLVSIHFGCGAWHGEWPEFQNILGRVWHGAGPGKPQHDPRGPFTVHIVDPAHPVTSGMSDFETEDELYTCLTGDAPIHLLAEATSKVDQKAHAMAFVRQYGKGRVFLTTLGHDVRALTNGSVPRLIRQGVSWAASRSGGTASRSQPSEGFTSPDPRKAVLARLEEIQAAAQALNPDKVFSYVLENDAGALAQNGKLFRTRTEALESTRQGFQGLESVGYSFDRQDVSVLSPVLALVTGEGSSSATTKDGRTFTTHFAQSVLIVLTNGQWSVLHSHRSFVPAR
jgi:type 1 glutamine amidotransferase